MNTQIENICPILDMEVSSYSIHQNNSNGEITPVIIRANLNENSLLTTSTSVTISSDNAHQYPTGKHEGHLRNILSQRFNVTPNNIVLSNGADGSLDALCALFVQSGTVVLHWFPTYDYMILQCQRRKATVVQFESLEYIKSYTSHAVVYICNPNNPDGKLWDTDELFSIVAQQPHLMFIVDEAYVEFGGTSILNYQSIDVEKLPNLFIIRTFSKAYGMAGVRLGYTVTSKKNVQYMQSVLNEKFVTNYAIQYAMKTMEQIDVVEQFINEIMTFRTQFGLSLISLGFSFERHAGGNFVFCKHDNANSSDIVTYLRKNGILIREKYGSLRITICSRDEMGIIWDHLASFLYINRWPKIERPIAVILTAGMGTRFLDPHEANNNNKCIYPFTCPSISSLSVTGQTGSLLRQKIIQLNEYVSRIIVVTGHSHNKVSEHINDFPSVLTVFNPDYAKLGNWKSALVGLQEIQNHYNTAANILLIDGDLHVPTAILKRMSCHLATSTICVDGNLERISAESMKTYYCNINNSVSLSKYTLKNQECVGEFIGLSQIVQKDLEPLIENLRDLEFLAPNEYYEAGMQKLKLSVLDTFSSDWVEVDTKQDLIRAQNILL